jgi:hypothetical protein
MGILRQQYVLGVANSKAFIDLPVSQT